MRIAIIVIALAALVTFTVPALAVTPIALSASVGPGFTISLKRGSKVVTKLKKGSYRITVKDQSSNHNFHLKGPAVDKKSTIQEVATKTWNVILKVGKYNFVCDPHRLTMKGMFTVTQ